MQQNIFVFFFVTPRVNARGVHITTAALSEVGAEYWLLSNGTAKTHTCGKINCAGASARCEKMLRHKRRASAIPTLVCARRLARKAALALELFWAVLQVACAAFGATPPVALMRDILREAKVVGSCPPLRGPKSGGAVLASNVT